jgi:hypothetical protein
MMAARYSADLAEEFFGTGLGERGDQPEGTGVRDGGDERSRAHPLHPALHDRVADAEYLGEARLDHRSPSPAMLPLYQLDS